MTPRPLILATAGHVDHGKTALIKALTGTDTDRLPEEKARGITIDLGFAHLALPGFSLGVIDVPGHEDFLRNMIAGLGAIDLALLVVAADDGWMPQTEEHWQILNYLGLRRVVVAITKSDLADPARAATAVREKLSAHSLGEIPIVFTSVRTGTGLEELKRTLARVCETLPPACDIGKPRLFVDRVFSVHGSGTIVTGTLTGGLLKQGDNVVLQPQNLRARVRALQSHNQPLATALPGTRTALNLPDLRPEDIPRGTVLTTMENAEASRTIDVLLERAPADARPLKNSSVIQMHYGSARSTARITLLDRRELLPGEKAIARLHCTGPVFVFAGDRFILRDSPGRATIAGGIVLNPVAEGTKFRAPAERNFLQARAIAPNDLPTLLRTQLQRDKVSRRATLLAQSPFSTEEIRAALDETKEVVRRGEIVADATWWDDTCRRAEKLIAAGHEAHPERWGIDLSEVRAALALPDPDLNEAIIAELKGRGFILEKGEIRRSDHRPSLPAPLAPAGAQLRAALAARPFDPPSAKELALSAPAQQALRFLCETGEATQLSGDLFLATEAFNQMKALLAQSLRTRGPATSSELRQVLGTSRRVLIPFLERCDRDGLTIREGDRRRIR